MSYCSKAIGRTLAFFGSHTDGAPLFFLKQKETAFLRERVTESLEKTVVVPQRNDVPWTTINWDRKLLIKQD